MKIGLIGKLLLTENPAGVEKYTYNIFNALAKIDEKNQYVIYFDKEPESKFFKKLIENNKNFEYKVLEKNKSPLVSWTQMTLANELLKNPVDVVFFPNDTVTGIPTLLSPHFKTISTIHDLGYKNYNEYGKKPFLKFLHHYTLWYVMLFTNKIVVPSESVRDDVLKEKWFGYDPHKIIVIPEAVDEKFHKYEKEKIDEIREKYGIGKNKYLHFISTIQPRKNIPNMIEGFALAIKQNPKLKDTKLLISGKNGWDYEESLNAPKKFGIEQNVMFLGRTPDEDLPIILSGAEAFINVSFEEGFGLPVLEAMASEVPLIISDIKVFREIAESFATYVDPYNPQNICEGIITTIEKKANKEHLEKIKEYAKNFTWEKSAEKLLQIFENI